VRRPRALKGLIDGSVAKLSQSPTFVAKDEFADLAGSVGVGIFHAVNMAIGEAGRNRFSRSRRSSLSAWRDNNPTGMKNASNVSVTHGFDGI
jgi:hypothetical protein